MAAVRRGYSPRLVWSSNRERSSSSSFHPSSLAGSASGGAEHHPRPAAASTSLTAQTKAAADGSPIPAATGSTTPPACRSSSKQGTDNNRCTSASARHARDNNHRKAPLTASWRLASRYSPTGCRTATRKSPGDDDLASLKISGYSAIRQGIVNSQARLEAVEALRRLSSPCQMGIAL